MKLTYHYHLYKASDPSKIVAHFSGQIRVGEKREYSIYKLIPGNYVLVGLRQADPRPGNTRMRELMIYCGQETVYDVVYLPHFWDLTD